ncbi:MAG TPA: hypothetical protein VFR58_09070 [Flavisolibacter sp.]|nr:hypothetical protein [Flavisolibacter sp.]
MSEQSKGMEPKDKGLSEERAQAQGAGGANSDHQNASATRGGTTDMDQSSVRGAAGNSSRGAHGSGIGTKTGLTGSDYDGQVTER